MSILHLLSHSHQRGSEVVAMELADELSHLGHRNRLVALSPALNGDHEPGLEPLVRSRREGPLELLPLAWRVRRVVADEPVDVVMAHGGWPAQVAALAVPRGGPLLVWQRILGFPDKVWRPGRRRWWGAVARRFDVGVALTGELEAELRGLGFRGPVWIIPNSRKPDRFIDVDRTEAAARLRAEIGLPYGVQTVGLVAHLVRQKRPERALEMFAELRGQGRRVHLVVAGTGPLQSDLEAQAEALGIADAVAFLGHRSDVEWIFGGVDLAVLTSQADAMPGVAIEAVMSGCPMVTVPVGGVAEVIEHGVTGLVLEGDDPVAMAAAVAQLLDDDMCRSAMSIQCRQRAPGFSASATAAVYAERLTAALPRR
jgi:glycosyltransferase involved in cell wall biosynthesis